MGAADQIYAALSDGWLSPLVSLMIVLPVCVVSFSGSVLSSSCCTECGL